ncbi:hypothetical protein FPQ18DRAFT_313583 [Pyronema domesticum]|uniref:Uncharacterized protein n=1 Tax=Pyronema omphalodes (strain CBS 100304) TaxID=1076935 RepID=U4L7N6_PYROM|nr:hypothetical protein FPQ18DRAFT_313583 [Pyronema domesticum]CCX06149.1 Similar to hypothetical protein VDAG_07972 [Verticillium dahliae VdLs.17]; acc. no. EGY16808 [Pyronema omphalodes CBS 100304]
MKLSIPTLLGLLSLVSASDPTIPGSLFSSDPASAAKQSAPFWFFGRSLSREPCYPESAVTSSGGPNPGTAVSTSPGAGCPSPGPWTGTYSPGNSFPTYYMVRYCSGDDSWRISYNLYFSHDGMTPIGHRHDWEWVAAIWKKCDGSSDTWCRNRLVRSFHTTTQNNDWGAIQNTINDKGEIRNLGDKNKRHPLIYVGAFKHAMFDTRKTTYNVIGLDEMEFRSNDWWYFAQDNLVPGTVIDRSWNFGDATSSPPVVWDSICSR